MSRILLGLLISYAIIMVASFALGMCVDDDRTLAAHFGLGLFATLFTCLVHCIVLTYFIITGKLIKQAVLRGQFDEGYIRRSQRTKGRITLVGVTAVVASLAAAVLGAWANIGLGDSGRRGPVHMMAELLAVGCNALAFVWYYAHIQRNAGLVDEVFARLHETRRQRPSSPDDEPGADEPPRQFATGALASPQDGP